MKRFISSIMAVVMILCMCPEIFAETKAYVSYEFSDFDEIEPEYREAVELAVNMNILSGYPDGSFNPKGGLTRGAAAKIITNFKNASNYQVKSAPFPDVPVNHTFAVPIAYCVSQNIISGYSDGTFSPAGPLTGYAFAKMLLASIGYTSNPSRYMGTSWKDAVEEDSMYAGISDLIPTLDKNITREEAAAMWRATKQYEEEMQWEENGNWDNDDGDDYTSVAEEIADPSSPALNTAVVSVDGSDMTVFHLGYSENTSQGKYRFYLFSPASGSQKWWRLVLDIDPSITAGQTVQQGKWGKSSSYNKRKLSVVWSREGASVSCDKTSITMTTNKDSGSHMEGEFEAYSTQGEFSVNNFTVYGSFNLNFGEYDTTGKKLHDEIELGLSRSNSSESSNISSGSSLNTNGNVPSTETAQNIGGSNSDIPASRQTQTGSSSVSGRELTPCTFCSGLGRCPKCRGDGVIDCPDCWQGKCPKCGGDGKIRSGVGSYYREKTCSACRGSGNCRKCGGFPGELKCPTCHGQQDCPICHGDRWV